MRYAQVCLDIKLAAIGNVLTYAIPDALDGKVQLGSCVAVPLRERKVIGYVVAISDAPPPLPEGTTIKPVLEVLSPEPLFDDHLLRLAHAIARYYHCSLDEALQLVIPSGWQRVAERVFRLTDPEASERVVKSALQRAIVQALQSLGGEATYDELSEALGEPSPRQLSHALGTLKQKGIVEEAQTVRAKPTRPRPMKAVRLSEKGAQVLRQLETDPTVKTHHRLTDRQLAVLYRLEEGVAELLADLAEEGYDRSVIQALVQKGLLEELKFVPDRSWETDALAFAAPIVELTDEQQKAVDAIVQALGRASVQALENASEQDEAIPQSPVPRPVFLLHGVTASGKTEVYLRVAENALQQGKGVIVLVPEIALTAQIVGIFRHRFGDKVAVWHSALLPSTRYEQWRKVKSGECPVVIGARSALFAPVPNLGLIIVDEEHDHSYKQEQGVRYHAREVALMRAKLSGAVVVFGTATPSLDSYYRALKGEWTLLRLTQRVEGKPLPKVQLIDERITPHRHSELLSDPLVEAMRQALREGEQVILFLNRRGYARVALCPQCQFAAQCPNCAVTLVYHADGELRCHHCGHRQRHASHCPQCGGAMLVLRGAGTERVEAEVRRLFPKATVLRLDRDAVVSRGEHARILNAFRNGEAQVLVGTQMVTKGLDFPKVTVVGVLNADHALLFPHYRAAEECFQLLTQVAGRAGRGEKPGVVFIQTRFPDHYAIQLAIAQDYPRFFATELPNRRNPAYPPYAHLVEVLTSDPDQNLAKARIKVAAAAFRRAIAMLNALNVEVLGPSECLLPRLQGRWRYHLLLRSRQRKALHEVVDKGLSLLDAETRSALTMDVDPLQLM
ncbi:MAG: primosomal protein N' [Armatimonadota bacterium]|jgi:primosomal protein N' (replication factor Y)|nr:primosomal protein N' [Armatimonadota bacterium]MDT7971823.1 primosomal protein N' [Armatimonadota bacterium]